MHLVISTNYITYNIETRINLLNYIASDNTSLYSLDHDSKIFMLKYEYAFTDKCFTDNIYGCINARVRSYM